MKFFRKKYDKDTFCVYRSVLKRIARDSEKAYKVGVEEGLVGNPKPTTEGLQDLLKGTKHHEELEAIYLFIYDACVAGYVTGQAKKVITPEVK